jgi:hypothetical protein
MDGYHTMTENPGSKIACQYKPTRNIIAMFLFDLQTVAFLVLKKARCIARLSKKSSSRFFRKMQKK